MTTALPLAVFFATGFAALLYQVTWQRLLVIFSGSDVYSAALIVAAFLAGLGAGSLAGGELADRLSRRASVAVFALSELAVAVFGFFSGALYYDVLYQDLGHLSLGPVGVGAFLFVSLLVPTSLIGLSLPLLARTLTETVEGAAATIGRLYGVHTLGSAAGALAATWWLLPEFGLMGTIRSGAALNVLCAAALFPLAARFAKAVPSSADREGARAPAEHRTPEESFSEPLSFGAWAALYGLSGLVALSVEIVWFRLLGVTMKSTAFTLGTLLALYLSGIGAGAVAGSRLVKRARRPGLVFLRLQAMAALGACGLLALLLSVVDRLPGVWRYLRGYEPLKARDAVAALPDLLTSPLAQDFVMLYLAVPSLLVLAPTFLSGCSFPFLQRAIQTEPDRVGRRVGVALLANIAGGVAGSLLTGWVLLDRLGTAGTVRLVAVAGGLFVWLAVFLGARLRPVVAGRRRVPSGALASGAALLVAGPVMVLIPGPEGLWSRLHGTTPDRVVVREDGSGLSVVRIEPGGRALVFGDGAGQSMLPYGDEHTALGALPALLHPAPHEALVIGLGSGDTVYAVASRSELGRITCVEINRSQLGALRALDARWFYGGLRGLLGDRRIEHVFADGRSFLMRSRRRYDLIEADALRPGSAGSGLVYSEEFFRLVRSRLAEGGLAVTWAPTARVRNAFVRVFPFVAGFPGILLGSGEPIAIDRAAVAARVADPRVRRHFDTAGIDIDALVATYLAEPVFFGPDFDRASLRDVNTDLFPRDEFDLGRLPP